MAIVMALPGFNDLGRSVTLIFLLTDHFLYRCSTFNQNMKKIYRLKVWIFFRKMHYEFLIFLTLRSSVRRFEMPFGGLIVVETLARLGIICVTGLTSLKIWLRSFASVDSPSIFSTHYKSLSTMLNYVRQFFKIKVGFHTLYFWNKVGDPQFFCTFSHTWLIIWLQ